MSDTEVQITLEVNDDQPEDTKQPAADTTESPQEEKVETPEPVAADPPKDEEPEATTPEEKAAEDEPEVAVVEEGNEDTAEEGKSEEDKDKDGETADKSEDQDKEEEEVKAKEEEEEEKVEIEVEEPIVISPEGNPHWLSVEDVLAKGLPDNEVENFKNFYFRQKHSLQSQYELLKDVALQMEFITLSKEEIEVLSIKGEVTEEQQEILKGLQDRVDSVIELYEGDGALVKINDRSAKDTVLDRSDETFVQVVRDGVINSLEVEKQSVCAYNVWKDQEYHPSAFKRGMKKLRASFRRPRASSTGGRRRPRLEEDKKKEEDEAASKTEEEESKPAEEGEPKPAEDGATPQDGEGEGSPKEVTVVADVEGGSDEAKTEEPKEEPSEGAATAEEPKEEEPKEEAKEEAADEKKEDEVKPAEDDGEIQAAAGDDEDKKKPDKVKSKSKVANKEDHMHKAAKSEPLDNQILRAFGRVSGSHYQVKDGKSAVEQLRESAHIRNDLNKLKAFGGVEGVQVSLSVSRWKSEISDHTGMIFRGFVYENELNALSQYNDTIYFPNVFHYKDTVISGKLQEFFQHNIKEILNELKNYVIDFFVAPDKIYVIRLSPFYTSVGACLYTWNEDGRTLTKGPFDFRIVGSPKLAPDAFSSYQPIWQDMLNSVLQQRKVESRPPSKCVIL